MLAKVSADSVEDHSVVGLAIPLSMDRRSSIAR
jgi:hypothetical protein